MKTKFLRVAQSGKTIDGREISPQQIDQMAATYNPVKYGARVWVEHLRSMLPDSPFRAYGDVVALKSEAGENGARVLLAQLDATPDLMQLSAARQKVYFSIELDPNFAGSGQAYMVGLAVTDSPASLATEMLCFSLKTPDKLPEPVRTHLFSANLESAAPEAEAAPTPDDKGFFTRVTELLSGLTGTKASDDARFERIEQALLATAKEIGALKASAGTAKPDAALAAKFDTLSADLAELKTKLETTSPDKFRKLSAGAGGDAVTDC